MTQRIFDVKNEKDYSDLWEIFPDYIDTIRRMTRNDTYLFSKGKCEMSIPANLIVINWHDKTEITREATNADIGKLCYFWDDKVYDDEEEYKGYAILTLKDVAGGKPYYIADGNTTYGHCRRLTKQEIEELC